MEVCRAAGTRTKPHAGGKRKQRARRVWQALLAVMTASCLFASAATAQSDIPPLPRPHPERVPEAVVDEPPAADAFAPQNNAVGPFDVILLGEDGEPLPPVDVRLMALLSDDSAPLADGVDWRVFGGAAGEDGTFPLVANVTGGTVSVSLVPGRYYVHALYGWAGATAQIMVTPDTREQTVVLNAGGLRLHAFVGEDEPIDSDELRFEISGVDEQMGGERVTIADDVRQDEILALSAGRYEIASYYGDTNAIVRADIEVKAGELTDLSLYHQAAQVTLKLVASRGGEALANTAWAVVNQGGEILFDSIGAFPTLVLAAGDYIAIAKHDDEIFESDFAVIAGRNRDVEVLAVNPVETEPVAEGGP